MDETRNFFTKKLSLIFAGGLVCGLVLGFFIFSNRTALAPINNSLVATTSVNQTASSSIPSVFPVKLYIDQQLPGNLVTIREIVTDRHGWVAVREANEEGEVGNILGARYVISSGTFKNIQLDLLRGMEDGHTYYGTFYEDNGDGAFDHETDLPLTDRSGKIFLVPFQVQASSPRG